MRCAIYARRSTEEHQVASLDVQIQEAVRYIESNRLGGRAWPSLSRRRGQSSRIQEAPGSDRSVERAQLRRVRRGRPARRYAPRWRHASHRPRGARHCREWQALVLLLRGERDHARRCYRQDHDALRGFAAELEREKIAGRTREHLETKARRGLNTGGRCYGYDNVPIEEGGRRVHVDYRINEAEGAIVREVFELRAAGKGYRPIAKGLNRRGVPALAQPTRQRILGARNDPRDVAAGALTSAFRFGGKQPRPTRGGTKVRLVRADDACIRMTREELRIVPQMFVGAGASDDARSRDAVEGWRCRSSAEALACGLGRCAECGGLDARHEWQARLRDGQALRLLSQPQPRRGGLQQHAQTPDVRRGSRRGRVDRGQRAE